MGIEEIDMKVGKQDAFSGICNTETHSINVRGKDLSRELIGKVDFTSYFFFLVTAQMPSEDQRAMLDAVLVAISEHGLVPSNQAARMTLAAAPDALQGAVAAGILGCGSVVLGSAEACGRFLAQVMEMAKRDGQPLRETALNALSELRQARKAVPGFGHSQHKDGDPRAIRLLELARERKTAGVYVTLIEEIETLVPQIWGRKLPLNVSGAIPAVMLDVGFPLAVLKGIPILARTASLIAHLNEEVSRPIGFILARNAAEAIAYDGRPLGGAN
jgi:citrate synthase